MKIKTLEPQDLPAIIALMRDFAEFEQLGDYFQVTEENLSAAMFGDGAFVEGLMAFEDSKPIAYALFYPNFASFRGQRGFYLEDIYIDENHRGKGIGEAMLRQIARIAKSRGYVRIDFQVLEWNNSAIAFYHKLGAIRNDDERHFKFTDAAFASLSA
ncbi:MAG: GNAT family N-acetyltransferase [Blastocatellia bacterium]